MTPPISPSPDVSTDFDLITDEKGRLVLQRPSQEDQVEVRVRRAFPWSHPDLFVSIRGKDGKEILMIDSLTSLPSPLADKLRAAMHSASLVPKIRRVLKLDMRFGHQEWTVETDRGLAEFRVQEREDVRFLHDGRFSVKDADGNIYEMPPESALDPLSLKLLQALI